MSPSVCSKRPKPWALSFSHWPLQTERQKRQKSKKNDASQKSAKFPKFPNKLRRRKVRNKCATWFNMSAHFLQTSRTVHKIHKICIEQNTISRYIEHVLSSGLHIEHHRATPDTAFHKGITEKKTWEIYGACEYAENTKHDLHCTSSDSSVAMVLDFELIGMLMRKNNARTMQAKEDHEEDSQN